MKLNAFTWIIITLAVTAWVFILPVKTVACLLVLQLILLLYIKRSKTMLAAIGGLGVFTGMMIALQLLFGSPLDVALFGGLRMLVMTLAFLCMLATTKIQSIAKALVERFHMPVEYAFMLTTALRFVPTFLEDIPSAECTSRPERPAPAHPRWSSWWRRRGPALRSSCSPGSPAAR